MLPRYQNMGKRARTSLQRYMSSIGVETQTCQENRTENVVDKTDGIWTGPTLAILLLFGVSLIIIISSSTMPEAQAAVDKFGVEAVYATKTGGQQWFMNMDNPTSDSRFAPKTTLTKNTDGSWKVRSDAVRMNVYTSTGYDQGKITTYNQRTLATKGYMQSSNDWKNIEMTGYVKLISGSGDTFTWYARGGRHSDSYECEGTAYKSWLWYNGRTEFAKEQVHPDTTTTAEKSATGSLTGKWIGFKFVMYNFQQNGKTFVKLETWLDPDNDKDFVKVDERIDSGGWGNDGAACGGSSDQIITWGGPIATFRWDDANNVDIKWFSVREITSPTEEPSPSSSLTISFANVNEEQTLSDEYEVVVTASDASKVSNIKLYVDSTFIKTENSAPYEFDTDTTEFSDGNHVLKAVATDTSGSTVTETVTVAFDN